MIPSEYLGPYLSASLVSVALLILAFKWPRLTRVLFVLIFLAAGFINIYTALTLPESYLNYGDMAVLELYRSFIHGFFSKHTQAIVLAIASGQLIVSALLTGSGYLLRMGALGGVIFLIAITPLGIGSAFPSTLVMAVALIVIQHRLFQGQSVGAK